MLCNQEKFRKLRQGVHSLFCCDSYRRRRKRSKTEVDKYKDEKEYWKLKKAMKFSGEEQALNDVEVDRNNMYLFPTIASCTSSEEETSKKSHKPQESQESQKPQKEEKHHHRHHHHHHHHRHHKK